MVRGRRVLERTSVTVVLRYDWSDGPLIDLDERGRIEQASRAQAIAAVAHRRHKDEAGEPLLHYVAGVANSFDPIEVTLECCVAWLSMIPRKTRITYDDLDRAGVHRDVLETLDLLTREGGIDNEVNLERIVRSDAACQVAHAEVIEKTRTSRLDSLPADTRELRRAAYQRFLDAIGRPWPNHFEIDQGGWVEFGSDRL